MNAREENPAGYSKFVYDCLDAIRRRQEDERAAVAKIRLKHKITKKDLTRVFNAECKRINDYLTSVRSTMDDAKDILKVAAKAGSEDAEMIITFMRSQGDFAATVAQRLQIIGEEIGKL